ncbi:T9SS type A sorting domain-containing protein [Chryseobacterium sp. KACC 21268]|nr:T9SS type A sorting domain-containing protein [Chryseobacterium sp. KACC 21268]
MKKNYLFIIFLFTQSIFYSQILLVENFTSGIPTTNWEIKDLDGDGFSWEFSKNVNPFPDGFAVSSSKSSTLQLKTNDVMVSPVLYPVSGHIAVSFKIGNNGVNSNKSHCAVYLIPANSIFTGSEYPIFDEVISNDYSQDFKFVESVVNNHNYPFKVVFRHYSEEVNKTYELKLDEIMVHDYSLSGTNETEIEKIKIYPNPVVDVVTIKGKNKIDKIEIYDVTGKLILESRGSVADLSKFSKGEYFMNIHTNNKIISQKILK